MREWQVFAELEPFGAPAGFWQAGMIASTLANVNRTKKAQKAYKPEDFMPQSMTPQRDDQSEQDVASAVTQIFQDLATLDRTHLKGTRGQ